MNEAVIDWIVENLNLSSASDILTISGDEPTNINGLAGNDTFELDFKGIKPKNTCGFISLNNENYFIVPKICDKNETNLNIFIYMLLYAYDIKVKNEDISNLQNMQYNFLKIFMLMYRLL